MALYVKMAASIGFKCNLFRTVVNKLKIQVQRYCSYQTNKYTWRTHTCGELRSAHVGQEVTLCGWIQYRRLERFIILRDCYGLTQLLLPEKQKCELPLESVIQVTGEVKMRPPDQYNENLETGQIEVSVSDFQVLNKSKPNLPFSITSFHTVKEQLRLQYRYLDLRHPEFQYSLRTRSEVLMRIREFLNKKHGFVEVETPTLFRRTPGGAHEFIVPTQIPEKYYSLCQSPQQFKQLLMVGGLDRYYQIARCYRDEGSKPNRQPEFTQIDIELSFTTVKHTQVLIEQMLQYCWPHDKDLLEIPFTQLTYKEAMETYGTDKPDLRFDMKLKDITPFMKNSGISIIEKSLNEESETMVCALTVPEGMIHIKSNIIEDFRSMGDIYSQQGLLDIGLKSDSSWKSKISKYTSKDIQQKVNEFLNAKPDDLVLVCAGNKNKVLKYLGKLRVECSSYLRTKGINIYNDTNFKFLWIVDFPLFLYNELGELETAHHPFSAPHPDDINLLYTNPQDVRGLHYDLVLNGEEVGGGSIRIHDSKLQEYILKEILKEDVSEMHYFLEALESGCPPHGGIALGVDRIMSILLSTQSIRDVIAFPKTTEGKDLMSGAPSSITNEEKKRYHIKFI